MKHWMMIAALLAVWLASAAAETQQAAHAAAALPAAVTSFAASAAAPTGSAVFVFAPGHFRVSLPPYWTVVPHEALLKYLDTLRETLPGRATPNYVVAFQRKALFDFALPYVLVELNPGPPPTRVQVEGEVLGFETSIGLAYGALHRAGKFGEVRVQPAVYDEERHVIIGRYSLMRAEDKRRLACVTAIFPYREGFVRLHGFMRLEDQERDAPAIDALIASLQFDSGFEYVPPPASSAPLARHRNLLLGGLIALMGVYIILRVVAARSTPRR